MPTFAGVTIGEGMQAELAQMGDPALVVGNDIAVYTYLARDGSATEMVTFVYGNVVSVMVLPPSDWTAPLPASSLPAATALGATYGASASTIPPGTQPILGADHLEYTIGASNATIDFMSVRMPTDAIKALPPSPKAIPHGGTSFDDAIVVVAPNEGVGARIEYFYLALNHCDNGHWRLKPGGRLLVNHNGRPYDTMDSICTAGDGHKTFYFDISGYFGKP